MNTPCTCQHCPCSTATPFDRLLVVQALTEKMALLTDDQAIAGYDVEVVW